MRRKRHDDIVIVGGEEPRPVLRWLIDRLAKHPGWVTAITFVAGGVVTWIILGLDDRLTLTDTVTMLAALWALFFAVMIYLLSAEDTDHILQQITDLQSQLSTALASPDLPEDEVGEEPTEGEPIPAASTEAHAAAAHSPTETPSPAGTHRSTEAPAPVSVPDAPGHPDPAPLTSDATKATASHNGRNRGPGGGRQSRDRSGRSGSSQILTTVEEIEQSVPVEFLDGWKQGTDLPVEAITRAWTRDPQGRQWVFEEGDNRWLAFTRGRDGVALMRLRNDPRQVPGWREQQREQRRDSSGRSRQRQRTDHRQASGDTPAD